LTDDEGCANPVDHITPNVERNALDTLEKILKSKYTAQQTMSELLTDRYFGLILRYLETKRFDIDMIYELRFYQRLPNILHGEETTKKTCS